MSRDPRPACLVTGAVSAYRVEPFGLLAEQERVEILAWGGAPAPAGLPVRSVSQLGAARLAASGRYRVVVCGLGGRLALPGCYVAARAARVPFVLWASMWRHPRSAAHLASYLPTRHLYRHADAVVTYGPHVSTYVEAVRGGRGRVFEAPQTVSIEHFGAPVDADRAAAARARAGAPADGFLALFVGRLVPEKGVRVLLEAWSRAGLGADAALAFAGEGPLRGEVERAGGAVRALGAVPREELPALYAAADALVLPSLATGTFLEPWGLVVNEAMLQSTPVITSTAVGAAAGGLVRDGRNGLVTVQGVTQLLADGLRRLYSDESLRQRLGTVGRADALTYTGQAWTRGVRNALASVGASTP